MNILEYMDIYWGNTPRQRIIKQEQIRKEYSKFGGSLEPRPWVPLLPSLKELLQESYKQTQLEPCRKAIQCLRSCLRDEIDKSAFTKTCQDLQICFERLDGSSCISGEFSPSLGVVIVKITDDIIYEIKNADDETLNLISDNFWTNFVHEDTHQQQFNKSHLSFKNYKPSTIQYWDDDFDENFGYFNQSTEADAYGREIGARLFVYYKNFKNTMSVKSIFKDIINNNIDDPYSKKIINVYKDPRIERSNMKKFYRAMYDFLENNEKSKERYIEK